VCRANSLVIHQKIESYYVLSTHVLNHPLPVALLPVALLPVAESGDTIVGRNIQDKKISKDTTDNINTHCSMIGRACKQHSGSSCPYGVATSSRLLKITGLFCRISSLYRALLQKRPVILRSLLLEATPYFEARKRNLQTDVVL